MARLFASASNQYLRTTAPTWSLPISLACWLRPQTDAPGDEILVSVGNASGDDYYSLRTESGSNRLRAQVYNGASATYSEHLTALSGNTWYHGLAVFGSSTSRILYRNGDPASEDTTSMTAGYTATSIAVSADNTPFGYFDGRICEVAIWLAELVEADAKMLAAGMPPFLVQPESLEFYCPELRTDQDLVGGYDMTAYNSPTWADHAPKISWPIPASGYWLAGVSRLLRRGFARGVLRGLGRGV